MGRKHYHFQGLTFDSFNYRDSSIHKGIYVQIQLNLFIFSTVLVQGLTVFGIWYLDKMKWILERELACGIVKEQNKNWRVYTHRV